MTARIGRVPDWLLPAPAIFLMAWGGNHFTPLLHVYETVGGYAPWQANLLLGMYVAGLVPGMLLAAGLSDHHGRRPIAIAGLGAIGRALARRLADGRLQPAAPLRRRERSSPCSHPSPSRPLWPRPTARR